MRRIGRPKKYRIVKHDPSISYFSPRGKPGRPDILELTMDELETIRLIDYMGFSQKEAAKSMKISQPTLSRAFKKARKIVANALVKGTAIKIQGGSYVITTREESPQEKPQEAAK